MYISHSFGAIHQKNLRTHSVHSLPQNKNRFVSYNVWAGFTKHVTRTINYKSSSILLIFFMPYCFLLGLDFSKDGKYMALAERRNCKDYISIFHCSSWQLVKVHAL